MWRLFEAQAAVACLMTHGALFDGTFTYPAVMV